MKINFIRHRKQTSLTLQRRAANYVEGNDQPLVLGVLVFVKRTTLCEQQLTSRRQLILLWDFHEIRYMSSIKNLCELRTSFVKMGSLTVIVYWKTLNNFHLRFRYLWANLD